MWVYFISPEPSAVQKNDRGLVKIGYSWDVEKRLNQLQTGSPFPIRVVARIACADEATARSLERKFHTALGVHRRHGEWFRLGKRGVKQMKLLVTDHAPVRAGMSDSALLGAAA